MARLYEHIIVIFFPHPPRCIALVVIPWRIHHYLQCRVGQLFFACYFLIKFACKYLMFTSAYILMYGANQAASWLIRAEEEEVGEGKGGGGGWGWATAGLYVINPCCKQGRATRSERTRQEKNIFRLIKRLHAGCLNVLHLLMMLFPLLNTF